MRIADDFVVISTLRVNLLDTIRLDTSCESHAGRSGVISLIKLLKLEQ